MEHIPLKAPLNTESLARRLVEKGLNRSDLARRIGVNRNTIRRWLNGNVRYALMKNLAGVAQVMDCSITDLIEKDELLSYKNPSDQLIGARRVDESYLEDVLMEAGELELLDEIVRAVIHPDLPGDLLGRLYTILAGVALQRDDMDAARDYALRGLELARKHGDLHAEQKANLILGKALDMGGLD